MLTLLSPADNLVESPGSSLRQEEEPHWRHTHIFFFLPLISKRVSPPRHYHYELSLAMPRQGTRCDVTGAERVATDMAELILLRCSTQIWSCRDSLASLRRHTEMSAEGRDRFKGEQGGGPYVRYIRSTSAAVNIIKISYSIICFYYICLNIRTVKG